MLSWTDITQRFADLNLRQRIMNMDWIVIIVILIFVCGLLSVYHSFFYSPYLVSPEIAKMLIGNRQVDTVLDVRTPEEYAAGHYDTALNVEYTNVERDAPKVIANKNATVLVYCRTGHRAKIAADKLRSMGYKNVMYVSSTWKGLQ
jgi:rhodanese-related sulfurtransferase